MLLVGCSAGEVASGGSPSATSSTSPPAATASQAPTTTAPSAAAPTLPAYPQAATYANSNGQVAFLRHWVDVYNYGLLTGDTAPLKAITDPAEGTLWGPIDEMYASGGHIVGHTYSFVYAEPAVEDEGVYIVVAAISQLPGAQVSASGVETKVSGTDVAYYHVRLRFEESTYRLVDLSDPMSEDELTY